MIKAEIAVDLFDDDLPYGWETTKKSDTQEDARAVCETWLEEKLNAADVHYEEIEIERTDGEQFQVWIWAGQFNLIGSASIVIEGQEDAA